MWKYTTPKYRINAIPGWELDYLNSKEWLDVQDKLDRLDKHKTTYTPRREDLFRALNLCKFADCNVAIFGQDPYPDAQYATGVAFSSMREECDIEISKGNDLVTGDRPSENGTEDTNGRRILKVPPSLQTIYTAYVKDLGYPYPTHGSLEPWCKQGVLLWNTIPIFSTHQTPEGFKTNLFAKYNKLDLLTEEIVQRLSAKGKIIFVFCGQVAQTYANDVDIFNNQIIYTSHPSPRGQISPHDRFIDARLFSTINAKLNQFCKEPIDWRLD
jgi:uracil-DNA glycosylase